MSLTFREFSRVCRSRCLRWHALDLWSPMEWGAAMAGEAGELCNALKKLKRHDDGLATSNQSTDRAELVQNVADEICDVISYLDLVAASLDIDLEEAVIRKFNIVSDRLGFPEKFEVSL